MDNANELRKKYMDNPPEGYTKRDFERMSDEELLDMEYFFNENIFDVDEDNYFGLNPSQFSDCIEFKCTKCGMIQKLPKQVADNLVADFGNAPDFKLQLPCNKCDGYIVPVNYTDSKGIIYKF